MKKVLSFVKGKKEERKDAKVNPPISVEITNPSGQKITSDDEHIVGLQQGYGYSIDINGKDRCLSKLHKASWYGNLEKVKLHSKKIDVNSVDWNNRTPLHLAVAQGHTEVAWYLLNNNAAMTICDNDGLNPFLKAIECGHKDCANVLIECGVDIKTTDKNGNTGLHIAAKSGFYNIATLLLKEGANLNTANTAGDFPIHLATSFDHREMVEQLLRNNANVDIVDRERRTPLMLAARAGLSAIIKVLLDSGASLEAVDSNGWTAEDYAQFGGHHDLVDLLKVQKKEELVLDGSDKLSVQSSDTSENINSFEGVPGTSEAGQEELPESPKSPKCVIPPALEPPRSWDLLQSGVIDQEGADVRRRSLITLGAMKREGDGGSCENPVTTTEFLPVVLTPTGDCIPMEMCLSPEPPGREPTPERRTRSPLERANSLDLPSDQDSPLIGTPENQSESMFLEINGSPTKTDDNNLHVTTGTTDEWNSENNNNITLDKLDNVIKPIEFGTNINENSPPATNFYLTFGELNTVNGDSKQQMESLINNKIIITDEVNGEERNFTMELSQSYDNLEEKSFCTDNAFTGVSSSLDNLEDIEEKTMSIEIIQSTGKLDDTLAVCTFPAKSKFRESHSLEILEDTGDIRSHKNKRHSRNKSITLQGQPQFWRSADVIPKSSSYEKCTNIDAQLECYDEALRQLAKVNIPKSQPPIERQDDNITKSSQANFTELSHNIELKYTSEDDTFPQVHDIEPISMDFPPEVLENEPDSLDAEKDSSFPPPPTYFMENEDNEIMHINTVEACLQTVDINLPLPISMLTPIKENNFESDSLSNVETHDGEESESSIVDHENDLRKSSSTPSHFNVEVIVKTKSAATSPSSTNTPVNGCPGLNYIKPEQYEASNYFDDSDDVFFQEGPIPDHYQKYFVDVRALQIHPDQIDFTKVIIPNDSPSPESMKKSINISPLEVNNSPADDDLTPTNKFPSLNFDIGGICNMKPSSPFVRVEKGANDAELGGRQLGHKRQLLLAMRDGEGVDSKESIINPNINILENVDDDEDDSDEDPPFWQSTDKGGYFVRQNTVIPINAVQSSATLNSMSIPGPSHARIPGTSSPQGNVSEAETASASDTPKYSPKSLPASVHSLLKEAAAEKGKLEEKALSLLGTAERLKFELEDSRLAEAARQDTIAALQTQLARLECRYVQSQEEVCTLQQRALSAEKELEHLRTICLNLRKDKSEMYNELNTYLEGQCSRKQPSDIQNSWKNVSPEDIHIILKRLEEEKKIEKDKNKRLSQHLDEVLMTNQKMIVEREALIAQNIADVRKLQEDTICWKERYEECAAKLEMMDKKQDPRLLEAQDTIATLKRTIAILQQEKTTFPKLYDVSTSTVSPRKQYLSSSDSDTFIEKEKGSFSETTLAFLHRELKACQQLLESYEVEQMSIADGHKCSEIDNEVGDLQQKLKREIARREAMENHMRRMLNELQQRVEIGFQLENMHRRLEKDFVSRREIEEIKCLQEVALERIKKEVINESDHKLSTKLAEINSLIQCQMKEQARLEQIRTNSESSIKQEFENISNTLQIELGKIQSALKAKEITEKSLRKKCEEMEVELKKTIELAKRSSTEDEGFNHSLPEKKEVSGQNSCEFIPPGTPKKRPTTLKLDLQKDCGNQKPVDARIKALKQSSLEDKMNDELKEKYIKKQ